MSKLFSDDVEVLVNDEPFGKLEPDTAAEEVVEEFKEKAKEEIKKEKKAKIKPIKKENKVKVEIKNLNVRKGPGIKFAKEAKFLEPGEYVILKEENGYGKIGEDRWIALKYTVK
jgi:hypothetical protein